MFIQLRCAAAGVFYADKGAVQDAHAVGVHRQQKLLVLGIVIKADGDRLHRKGGVGVGRVFLVQFFAAGDGGKQLCRLLELFAVYGEENNY